MLWTLYPNSSPALLTLEGSTHTSIPQTRLLHRQHEVFRPSTGLDSPVLRQCRAVLHQDPDLEDGASVDAVVDRESGLGLSRYYHSLRR